MSKFYTRWKRPLIKSKILSGLCKYPGYIRDMLQYSRMDGAEEIKLADTYPCLFDKTAQTGVDSHYFYQDIWAFKKICSLKPNYHVDVGSSVGFIGFLSAVMEVHFVDIRPLKVSNMKNIKSVKGSILEMPYEDGLLKSLSCLHVAEHIGLGRYGDPLDPLGTKKATAELIRCLAPNGNLFFALPIGKPRLCFNAHRIHSPQQIVEYFGELELVEFSATGDDKQFIEGADPAEYVNQRYACGMFWFRKRG